MVNSIPKRCPSCGDGLLVRVMRCPTCGTQVEGDYALDRFMALSVEQRAFCELFIRCRGSLKDVGAAMGVSYPTARNRLDELIQALGFETETEADRRKRILQQLAAGQINAEQAMRLLDGQEDETNE